MVPFAAPISQQIWDMKYRFRTGEGAPVDADVLDSWRRVARALAAAEADPPAWEERFLGALERFRFLPAGRILSGAGTGRAVTLFNCFVMGTITDSMEGIFQALKEAALTMQQGGGIGYDFSTLRPRGAPVAGVGADASGPLSFMDVWDAMCRTIMSAGSRRGAMMATMRCDHPDIEEFVTAKQDPARLRMFNLSVLVTDAFMQAVEADADWPLVFSGRTHRTVRARELWDRIMRATYDYAEPGVIFIDRVNRANNLAYAEAISATNPCGEQPLPPYGACLLGSVNLAVLVREPFGDGAGIDRDELEELVGTAVRMMDDVVDVSRFPLPQQAEEARAKRRIGLGVTGLADALAMCGLRYGGEAALAKTAEWLEAVRDAAYRASVGLAREKGAFPLFDRDRYLEGEVIRSLPQDIRDGIAEHGIRNALLTSIAPTGTISLFAGNVSSGIEPIFAYSYTRKVLQKDGSRTEEEVVDYAVAKWRALHGDAGLPDSFVSAQTLDPMDHVRMQAVAQRYVDSSISKTINVPAGIGFDAFKDVYAEAYRQGCKGCTTYRPNEVTGSVLAVAEAGGSSGNAASRLQQAFDRSKFTNWIELARASDVDASVLTKYKNGGRTISKRDAGRLSEALGISAGWLLFGEGRADLVETAPETAAPSHPGEIVYISEPLERPETLEGVTYKLKWPESAHAIYITMNDVVTGGRRRPFEIFINSKNMEHYAWTVALTRMISAVFRRGGDVSFVVEELKAVFDPRGGAWIKGKYVPSILAAIGGVIERHLVEIGFIGGEGLGLAEDPAARRAASVAVGVGVGGGPVPVPCPRCGGFHIELREGCEVCLDCGHSKCE